MPNDRGGLGSRFAAKSGYFMGRRLRSASACLVLLALGCDEMKGRVIVGSGAPAISAGGAAGDVESAGPVAGAPPAGTNVGAGDATGDPGATPFSAGAGAGGSAGGMSSSAGAGGSGGSPGPTAATLAGGAGGAAGTSAATAGNGNVAAAAGAAGAAGAAAVGSGGACQVWPTVAAPAPAELTFNGVTLKSSEHDCAWMLGAPVALPVMPDHTRLLFHYDVNGDGVDDLFVGTNPNYYPNPPDPTYVRTITLLLSKIDGGVLSFEPTNCTLDAPFADGEYALRDLDGDGVMDFVIGVSTGFRVILNHASGPELTVSYDFPYTNEPELYLGDVALGAFEADDTSELAIGFLRQADKLSTMQMGTLLFPNPTQVSTQAPVALAISNQNGNGLDLGMNPELGIFTAFQGGRALYGATAEDTWIYEGGKRTTTSGGNGVGEPTYLSTLTVGGQALVLAGLGSGAPPLDATSSYVYDPAALKLGGTNIPSAFSHGLVYGRSHSYLLLDVDGDGDLDLVENESESTSPNGGAPGFAVHNGDLATGPSSDWQPFYPGRFRVPESDTPFLAIGKQGGRLLVSDGDPGDPNQYPLRVMPVACGQ